MLSGASLRRASSDQEANGTSRHLSSEAESTFSFETMVASVSGWAIQTVTPTEKSTGKGVSIMGALSTIYLRNVNLPCGVPVSGQPSFMSGA